MRGYARKIKFVVCLLAWRKYDGGETISIGIFGEWMDFDNGNLRQSLHCGLKFGFVMFGLCIAVCLFVKPK